MDVFYSGIIAVVLITREFAYAFFVLSLSYETDTAGGDFFTFTCRTNVPYFFFTRDTINECIIIGAYPNGTCIIPGSYNTDYTFACNNITGVYNLTIPRSSDIDTLHGSFWRCRSASGTEQSERIQLKINTSITLVNIKTLPTDKNPIEIISGENQTFNCKTNAGRPSSKIQWYLSSTNITDLATPVKSTASDGKFTSSSELTYTGKIKDDGKIIYCTAANVQGKSVISQNKSIVIWFPITQVTVKTLPTDKNPIEIINGTSQMITCETDAGRPSSLIQWYLSGTNITELATPTKSTTIGNKFTSSSTLTYTGNIQDEGKIIYCTAINIQGQSVMSQNKSIVIWYPPQLPSIKQTPMGYVNETDLIIFTCEIRGGNPLASITWQCDESSPVTPTENPPTDKVVSSVKIIATKDLNGKLCTCIGTHPAWPEPKSPSKILQTRYAPTVLPSIVKTPPGIVLEGTKVKLTCEISGGNPLPSISWKCNEFTIVETTSTTPNDKVVSSIERNVTRTDDGKECVCTCRHLLWINDKKVSHILGVRYSPRVSVSSVMNLSTISEGGTAVLKCVAQGNPPPSIMWMKQGSNVILSSRSTKFQSNLTIENANCLDTSNYTCTAMNSIHNKQYSTMKDIELFVTCSPRRYNEHVGSTNVIGLEIGQNLTISEHILAYPIGITSWTFKPDVNSPGKTVYSDANCNAYKISDHRICFTRLNFTEHDFGLYTVVIVNEVGKKTLTIKVNPQGPPNQPTDVLVACEITSMIVSWRPGIKEGNEQSFRVVWLNKKTQQKEYSSEIVDSSQEQTNQYIVRSLVPDTAYIIYVEASNKYGIARSTNVDNCTTRSSLYNSQPNNSLAMSVGAGIGSSMFILLVAGFVIVILKRRLNNKEENSKVYQSGEPGTSRQKTSNDQHNYCELQTTRMDSNPDGMQSNSSNTYEEIGRIKDGQDYQNVDKNNKESREKHDTSNLYANMKI